MDTDVVEVFAKAAIRIAVFIGVVGVIAGYVVGRMGF